MRCWLPWMMAVCGIGSPSGRLNSATTAYQSASPPMVAASANAATKPNAGCSGSSSFAVTNNASVPASTSVASALTRRSSAARAASPGASNEKVAGTVMAAFGTMRIFVIASEAQPSSERAKLHRAADEELDCFVASLLAMTRMQY